MNNRLLDRIMKDDLKIFYIGIIIMFIAINVVWLISKMVNLLILNIGFLDYFTFYTICEFCSIL